MHLHGAIEHRHLFLSGTGIVQIINPERILNRAIALHFASHHITFAGDVKIHLLIVSRIDIAFHVSREGQHIPALIFRIRPFKGILRLLTFALANLFLLSIPTGVAFLASLFPFLGRSDPVNKASNTPPTEHTKRKTARKSEKRTGVHQKDATNKKRHKFQYPTYHNTSR